MKNPIATLKMKNGKEITIELYPQFSPNAVNSFINLANKGTFDNKDVKRIVPGFVLQPTYDEFVESDDYR
ncbi:MAG: peptidylprolyl isomerase, partial [Oscillospiraceae bacterium]